MLSKTGFPALLLAALVTTAALGGTVSGTTDPPAATPAGPLLLDDLLALAGIEGETGLDAQAFQALLGAEGAALGSPSAAVAHGESLLAALSAASSASDAFAAAAGPAVPGLAPTAYPPTPLAGAMVGLYLRLGHVPTATDMASVRAAEARLGPSASPALGSIVAATNGAIDAVHGGDILGTTRATGALLATIESATPALKTASTASACPAPPIYEDDSRRVVVRGTCDDTDSHHRVLQVDLGGNEIYTNRAGGGTTLGATDPVSVSIDLGAGSDTYSDTAEFAQGAGLNAIGVLLDEGGSDTYSAGHGAQGSATGGFGVGVLADLGGSDSYTGQNRVQGSTEAGFLLDLGSGDDAYVAGTASQGARFVPFPTGRVPAVLFDAGGDDSYTGTGIVQGAGNYLVDVSGGDRYTASGSMSPSVADGFAQGTALAAANGYLIDGLGNDHYVADIYAAQGFGVGNGLGALLDFGGDDTYQASNFGQAACTGNDGVGGLLYDRAGDDTYTAGTGQGASRAICGAYLVDPNGDDRYTAGPGSQGAAVPRTIFEPLLGALLDGGGHDTYAADSSSQGSGTASGVGLLLDADGTDSYTAGDGSQGSGDDATGILVDGVQDAIGVSFAPEAEADGGSVTVGGDLSVVSPSDDPPSGGHVAKADRYSAGVRSQGSGTALGTGLLLDNDDETTGGGAAHRSSFTAGDSSQGAGIDGGIGVLFNREGRDEYFGGAGSQGSAVNAPLGVLVDLSGRDAYTVPDPATSRGYGDSTTSWAALGLLVDGGDNHDAYSGAAAGNNACEAKGDTGLTVDANLPAVPPSCVGPATAALGLFAASVPPFAISLVIPPPAAASPCTGTELFCDDAEGADLWTRSDSLNTWQQVNQQVTPSASRTNAHSLTHYYFVGAPYPGSGYLNEDLYSNGAAMTSPAITLPAASTPTLTLSVAGGSENGFDFLHVNVVDASGNLLATLDSHSGATIQHLSAPYQTQSYSLAPFAGQAVHVQLLFDTDSIAEIGAGWNVDDIIVA